MVKARELAIAWANARRRLFGRLRIDAAHAGTGNLMMCEWVVMT
jgi:hypothetical protein